MERLQDVLIGRCRAIFGAASCGRRQRFGRNPALKRMLGFGALVLLATWTWAGATACAPAAPPSTSTPATPAPATPTAAPKPAATVAAPAATSAKPTPAAAAPAKLEKVKLMVILKGGPFLNFYLGKDKGLYAQEGLDVEIVTMSAPLAIQALTSGDIDYMGTATTEFGAGIKGLPIKAVLFTIKRPVWYIVGGPGVNSVDDLKGKPVGITAIGDVTHYAVKKGLKAKGLDPDKDVTYVAAPARVDKFAGLKAKSIAATLLSTPDQLVAEKEFGYKILVVLGDVVQFPLDGIGTTEKKLKENPEQVKRMLRGTLKTLAYMRDHREETVQYAMRELSLDQETAQVLFNDLIKSYTFDGLVSDEGIKELVESSIGAGIVPAELKDKVQVEKGLDTTLLREVLKENKP